MAIQSFEQRKVGKIHILKDVRIILHHLMRLVTVRLVKAFVDHSENRKHLERL